MPLTTTTTNKRVIVTWPDGLSIGRSTNVLVNSGGGTASLTIAAGVGVRQWSWPMTLANLTNADFLTTWVPGFTGRILKVEFQVLVAVTTAAKAATINLEIGTTDVTGGVVALTSANCTPKGVVIAGSAVTALNTFTPTDSISIEVSSVTAFVEGSGQLVVTVQNMDDANAWATFASMMNGTAIA